LWGMRGLIACFQCAPYNQGFFTFSGKVHGATTF
jgi:hypothetical protein